MKVSQVLGIYLYQFFSERATNCQLESSDFKELGKQRQMNYFDKLKRLSAAILAPLVF